MATAHFSTDDPKSPDRFLNSTVAELKPEFAEQNPT
jgi:hypothetical protein